jgi:hypothetical protein
VGSGHGSNSTTSLTDFFGLLLKGGAGTMHLAGHLGTRFDRLQDLRLVQELVHSKGCLGFIRWVALFRVLHAKDVIHFFLDRSFT